MIVRPTVLMVRNGIGAPARQASLTKMNCSMSVRPCPPYSFGQPMPEPAVAAHLPHGLQAGRAAGVADGALGLDLGGHQLGEVAPQLLAEGLLLVRVGDVHRRAPLPRK